MSRKRLILDLWAAQLTSPQIAALTGVSASYVRGVVADQGHCCPGCGLVFHGHKDLEAALTWIAENRPHLSEQIARLRNATSGQARNVQAA